MIIVVRYVNVKWMIIVLVILSVLKDGVGIGQKKGNAMIKRLIARNKSGDAYYPRCLEAPCKGDGCVIDFCEFSIQACEYLAAYEETGLTPKQIVELMQDYAVKATLLTEYQNAEENGLLLRLSIHNDGSGNTIGRLIDADRIDFSEVFKGESALAKDIRNAAQKLLDMQPTVFDAKMLKSGGL